MWGPGGTLSDLAIKTATRASQPASAPTGGRFADEALKQLGSRLAAVFIPPPNAPASEPSPYATPSTVQSALTRLEGASVLSLSKQPNHERYFRNSFVHNEFIRAEIWGDEACAPLVQLVDTLLVFRTPPAAGGEGDGAAASSPAQQAHAWLSSWSPLETHQHGDLNLDNVLIDARGSVWIIDFAKVKPRAGPLIVR